MIDYMLEFAEPEKTETTSVDLGRRATVLRDALGLTPEQAAGRAGIQTTAYLRFEQDGEATVSDMLAIHRVLSRRELDDLFTAPRFDDVEEYHSYLERKYRA
ncbi:hypothetical protein [Sphingomonas sp. R86520]|uniref:hypothetical protein n=1 Tax=Sphingomonas sp. R86520 TaxID=3093859 RepID=UPI0036D3FB3D